VKSGRNRVEIAMSKLGRLIGLVTLSFVSFNTSSVARSVEPRLVVDVARDVVAQPRRVRVVESEIFVLSGEEAIVVFDRDFNRKRRIGVIGRGPDDLRSPQDFDLCASGEILVADLGNNLIRRFDRLGRPQSSFASRLPNYIACLDDGNVAVGERGAASFIRVYHPDGKLLYEVGKPDPYPGATPQQSLAFQHGPFRALAGGEFLLAQALSIPPTAVILEKDGSTRERFALPTGELEDLLGAARERRAKALAEGRVGGRGTVGYANVHPGTRNVWVAPAAEGVFRFTPAGTLIDRLEVVDADGERYGFQDFDFLSPTEIVGRAGPWLVRARLSDAQ
jgi:hypothetical protein